MKQPIKQLLTASLVLALVLAPSAAWAHEGEYHPEDELMYTTTVKESDPETKRQEAAKKKLEARLNALKEMRSAKLSDKRADLQERLEGVKKKACENHQNTINRLMDVMNKRRENAFNRVTKISEAIQAFYTKKQLTVENYDELVATVDAAKQAAQDALGDQLAIPALNCEGDHPRADVLEFRKTRLDSIDAMKAYRDAVKELGKAVKNAVGDEANETKEG